jgi:dTDP-4-amino-4,6-dideoxygalactose transaminase
MIPFNKPYLTGNELIYIKKAHESGHLAGDGTYTKLCSNWLEKNLNCKKALLTHSCTAALEIAAILTNIKPGDEIIMPSYTFVSTANAFVLRGGIPVFVDIRSDTLNIDENLIEKAITKRTKAIVPVHYAGVPCDMDKIMDIAKRHNLIVIEDAAQGMMSTYNGKALGTIGDFGCLSFHETKNIISGEGGALLINNDQFIERAEIIREKGTNRSKFFSGMVDKYSWVDVGSSYLPSEIISAFLWAQLENANLITERRKKIWTTYHNELEKFQITGRIIRPYISNNNFFNAHMYYLLMNDFEDRSRFIDEMKQNNVSCVFHYLPLHDSFFGKKAGKSIGDLKVTQDISSRIVRLPIWIGIEEYQQNVINAISSYLNLK